MCEFCQQEKVVMKTKVVNLNMIQWCGNIKAKDLHILEDDKGVFIDTRGYLRLVNLDDGQCLDHGEKVKIKYCPFCGSKFKKVE